MELSVRLHHLAEVCRPADWHTTKILSAFVCLLPRLQSKQPFKIKVFLIMVFRACFSAVL